MMQFEIGVCSLLPPLQSVVLFGGLSTKQQVVPNVQIREAVTMETRCKFRSVVHSCAAYRKKNAAIEMKELK